MPGSKFGDQNLDSPPAKRFPKFQIHWNVLDLAGHVAYMISNLSANRMG
jgi:hypothetical protein